MEVISRLLGDVMVRSWRFTCSYSGLVVIIVTVVVTVVVVVAVGGVPSILKLSFMVIGVLLGPEFIRIVSTCIVAACAFRAYAYTTHRRDNLVVLVDLIDDVVLDDEDVKLTRNDISDGENVLILILRVLRIHACFRDELDNVVEEEDGGWICFLDGNNSLGTKKYRGSNSSDGGNTRDGVKIAGGEIGSGGGIGGSLAAALYACIYGSL
ncbi:hypothetical protein Tco_0959527 [Tanacetum coccineum]